MNFFTLYKIVIYTFSGKNMRKQKYIILKDIIQINNIELMVFYFVVILFLFYFFNFNMFNKLNISVNKTFFISLWAFP